jgi:hypothetical protein
MRQVKLLYLIKNYNSDFIEELCEKPTFEKEIEGLRHKWNINVGMEIHLSEENIESILQNKLLKNKRFIDDLKKLQNKFNLGEEWSSFVEEYIFIDFVVYNKMSNLFIEKRTGDEADSITGKPTYYLRIFPETTQKDIVEIWDKINEFVSGTKLKSKRQKPSKKNKRNKRIYKLAKLGFTCADIQKYIKNEFDTTLEYETIIKHYYGPRLI